LCIENSTYCNGAIKNDHDRSIARQAAGWKPSKLRTNCPLDDSKSTNVHIFGHKHKFIPTLFCILLPIVLCTCSLCCAPYLPPSVSSTYASQAVSCARCCGKNTGTRCASRVQPTSISNNNDSSKSLFLHVRWLVHSFTKAAAVSDNDSVIFGAMCATTIQKAVLSRHTFCQSKKMSITISSFRIKNATGSIPGSFRA
jgi:hypothetical protein